MEKYNDDKKGTGKIWKGLMGAAVLGMAVFGVTQIINNEKEQEQQVVENVPPEAPNAFFSKLDRKIYITAVGKVIPEKYIVTFQDETFATVTATVVGVGVVNNVVGEEQNVYTIHAVKGDFISEKGTDVIVPCLSELEETQEKDYAEWESYDAVMRISEYLIEEALLKTRAPGSELHSIYNIDCQDGNLIFDYVFKENGVLRFADFSIPIGKEVDNIVDAHKTIKQYYTVEEPIIEIENERVFNDNNLFSGQRTIFELSQYLPETKALVDELGMPQIIQQYSPNEKSNGNGGVLMDGIYAFVKFSDGSFYKINLTLSATNKNFYKDLKDGKTINVESVVENVEKVGTLGVYYQSKLNENKKNLSGELAFPETQKLELDNYFYFHDENDRQL